MTQSTKYSQLKDNLTPAGRPLGILTLLGTLAALWALFLWTELVSARAGGEPLCAFSASADCGKLWDAAFASAVHRLTGMPVAGWGLVWGVAALVLPLAALVALSEGKDAAKILAGVRWTAAGGLLGVGMLLSASAAARLFCTSCALTYLASIAYAAVTFLALPRKKPLLAMNGFGAALAAVAAAYLVLLYPGLRTPKSVAREGIRALAQMASSSSSTERKPASTSAARPELESLLEDFVPNLQPQVAQLLSDSLRIYRSSPVVEEEPRNLRGDPSAPVRITEFTDSLCSHCATLHGTISYLESVLPAGSFSVDSRQFPLDGNCNRFLQPRGLETVRCAAARAQICMESTPHAFEFAGAVFDRQEGLTEDLVFQLAAPFMERSKLEACMASAETERKLADDVTYAWSFEPDGTPLVLVNGRQGTAFGPFLYALILTGGNADHPIFDTLPAPREDAHIH